jgi:pyruvate/2-oxoglutarate dehydrogenase complex dihydrolipoamide dehydrogenase (E3) component
VEKAVRPDQALLNPASIGKKVVVIGGGLIGAETALALAEGGKREVTIVEMLESIAPEHEPLSQVALLYYLQEAGVAIHTGYEVKEISGDQVICKNTAGDTKSFSADTIVMATGLAAKKDAVKKLQNLAPQTVSIGDCVEGRKIYDCMHEAWRAVLNI